MKVQSPPNSSKKHSKILVLCFYHFAFEFFFCIWHEKSIECWVGMSCYKPLQHQFCSSVDLMRWFSRFFFFLHLKPSRARAGNLFPPCVDVKAGIYCLRGVQYKFSAHPQQAQGPLRPLYTDIASFYTYFFFQEQRCQQEVQGLSSL